MTQKIIRKFKEFINKEEKEKDNIESSINQEQMIEAIKEVTKELLEQDKLNKKLVTMDIDDETGYGVAKIGDTSFVTIITLSTLVDQIEILLQKIVTPQSDKNSVLTILALLEETKKLTLYDIKDKILIPPNMIHRITL